MDETLVAPRTGGRILRSPARSSAAGRLAYWPWFYFGLSVVLLLIVVAGFGRTLFFRAFFKVPQIPAYLFAHGAVLSAWFVGLCLQTFLVTTRRTGLHRRVGWVLSGIGLAVVIVSSFVTLSIVSRQRALGVDVEARLGRLSEVFWSDAVALIVFTTFVTLGVLVRHRAAWHKRLMLLATINIMSPALGRMWTVVPGLSGFSPTSLTAVLLTSATLALLVGVLALHDVRSRNRIHPVTLWGGGILLVMRFLAVFVIATSEPGRAFVRTLG